MACNSCGEPDEPLTEVRRVYITPADWDREETIRHASETEQWCDVCMLHYPHDVVEH